MEIDDFIGVFPKAIPDESCDQIIDRYEKLDSANITNRQKHDNVSKIQKDNEYSFHVDDRDFEILTKNFWEKCYPEYCKKYGILESLDRHGFYQDLKIQKINPGEGYHVWHCENDSRINGSRIAMVIGYLNDVDEGGETEFLYQHKRIKPEKGTIIICPSSFTHTHRGNPPLSNTKYIINGWIEYY